ncbi:hypothetical protein H5410_064637 [Solanum commersonii]|uniref:Uncharacterized protein n=1 Tax=Solanum commersonii TaxID=4109 RepID=A0A9J5VYX0_SOLCO|nr:hypothetical protein H5410_064637 [Solanum commersonii]
MEPSKGTSFFRTCFNGINALSDTYKSRHKSLSLSLSKIMIGEYEGRELKRDLVSENNGGVNESGGGGHRPTAAPADQPAQTRSRRRLIRTIYRSGGGGRSNGGKRDNSVKTETRRQLLMDRSLMYNRNNFGRAGLSPEDTWVMNCSWMYKMTNFGRMGLRPEFVEGVIGLWSMQKH